MRTPSQIDALLASYLHRLTTTTPSPYATPLLLLTTPLPTPPTLKTTNYRLTIPATLCNDDGNLHGGAAATLLDNLSSTALFLLPEREGWDGLGVSRGFTVTFHRAVREGEEVRVRCWIVALGRRMCQVGGVIWKVGVAGEGEVVCVSFLHDKVNKKPVGYVGGAKI